jgi:urease accessory protein
MEGVGAALAPTLTDALAPDALAEVSQRGMQRARGGLAVTVKLRDGRTVLDRFRQEGCLKARLPRPERDAWTSLVTLNSSGGIAQGDRLGTEIAAGPGTALTVASQAAERYYRSAGGSAAHIRTVLQAGTGAALEWLPQETILFDGCAVDRRLDIHLAADAWFLGVETLVFGRAAMGETLQHIRLRDTIRLHRDGRLVWQDAIRLDGMGQALLDRPAVAAGGRVVATLVHAAPDCGQALDGVRAALDPFDAGVSAFEGLLVARIIAADGACARAAIVAALASLRGRRPLPRVWSC